MNTYHKIKARASRVGLSMDALYREAGVQKQTVTRWAKNEPGAITTLAKMEAVLREREAPAVALLAEAAKRFTIEELRERLQ